MTGWHPLRVALTGGIATGKSTVLAGFAAHGLPTIDADCIARDVLRRGTPAWSAVQRRFGAAILQPDQEVDRRKLAGIVFTDPAARADLEGIVHPEVYATIKGWFSDLAAGREAIGIADIPLLFETGRERDFDSVVVVACAPGVQLTRLVARDGLSGDEARLRLAAQDPIEGKIARADYVIRTDGTDAETDRQTIDVLCQLRAAASS